jgi:uncharacterized membrane protein
MSPQALLARRVALWSLAAMILLLSVNIFGITRLELQSRAVLWAISTLPLLLFLPGLLRGAWKSYAWMCFALMVYFQVFVTEIFRKPNDLITIGLLASLLLLFCTAMVFVRLRRKELAGTGA